MSIKTTFLTLMFASGSVGLPAFARAETPTSCVVDTDCPHGFACQAPSPNVTPGGGPTCPTDAPDCAGAGGATGAGNATGAGVGGGTGKDAVGVDPTSAPLVTSTCQPAPCASNSDCAADMVCHTESYSECSGGSASPPCPAGMKCEVTITQPECTTKTTSMCVYQWQLPCNADADCGAGFACSPTVTGSCSGGSPVSGGAGGSAASDGAGTGTADGGAPSNNAATPTADMCTTTTSFPGYCHPVVAACSTDTDCPGPWVCVGTKGVPQPATDGGPARHDGSGTTGTSVGAADIPATATMICSAPNAPPIRSASDGTGTSGEGSAGTSGSGAPSGNGGSTTGPNAAGTGGANGGSLDSNSKTSAAPSDAGGCSVSARASNGGGVTLFALGMVGLVLARRRRRG